MKTTLKVFCVFLIVLFAGGSLLVPNSFAKQKTSHKKITKKQKKGFVSKIIKKIKSSKTLTKIFSTLGIVFVIGLAFYFFVLDNDDGGYYG